MPGGPPGRYQAMLKYHTDTDMPAEQIHQIGLREVANTKEKMHKVLYDVYMP